jgi:RecB family exonuclease
VNHQPVLSISNSEIATFDRCRRKWYARYYLGASPAEPEIVGSAILGTRVHAALEGMDGYGLDPLAVLAILYSQALEEHPDWQADINAEWDMARIMVEGYVEWAAETGADASLRTVAVEQEVCVPFPRLPGVTLRARLDRVVLDEETGLLSFLDNKTAATFEKHEHLETDPQFLFYAVVQKLARATARSPACLHDGGTAEGCPGCFWEPPPQVDGGIVRTLRRVKRTAASKPPYYATDSFRYSPERIEAAELRIEAICRQILDARRYLGMAYTGPHGGRLDVVNHVQRSELYPSQAFGGCKSWECPFVTLCPMMDDGSDWPGVIRDSGHWKQQDPYAYNAEQADRIEFVRAALAAR